MFFCIFIILSHRKYINLSIRIFKSIKMYCFAGTKLPTYINNNFIPKYIRISKHFCVFIANACLENTLTKGCDKKNYCLQDLYDAHKKN
jgi:hypothetical protein